MISISDLSCDTKIKESLHSLEKQFMSLKYSIKLQLLKPLTLLLPYFMEVEF